MGGGSRVYILDEAHMLSNAAWNAFLKTLEEPPPHVVFVLATTEAHKVPATIVDRCHRFDFHRPSLQQIASVLRKVADEEQIEVPDPAVTMIARSATGSFRDALGTLEQLVTYGGPRVKLDEVLEVLGVADAELVLDAAESLAEHDAKAALMAVERLSASGRDLTQFMRELAAHLRHLFVVQTLGDVPESFAVTAEHTDRLQSQAERISQAEVLRAIDLLAAALTAVKDGSDPRIQLEIALLKATQPQSDGSLQALAARVERLEQSVGGNAQPPRPQPSPQWPTPRWQSRRRLRRSTSTSSSRSGRRSSMRCARRTRWSAHRSRAAGRRRSTAISSRSCSARSLHSRRRRSSASASFPPRRCEHLPATRSTSPTNCGMASSRSPRGSARRSFSSGFGKTSEPPRSSTAKSERHAQAAQHQPDDAPGPADADGHGKGPGGAQVRGGGGQRGRRHGDREDHRRARAEGSADRSRGGRSGGR